MEVDIRRHNRHEVLEPISRTPRQNTCGHAGAVERVAGVTILLAGQNVQLAVAISGYTYDIAEGRSSIQGSNVVIAENPEARDTRCC